MKPGLPWALFALFMPGCLCGAGSASTRRFDEAGLLGDAPVRYEVRVRRNAADVTVNASVELAVCETFSEDCYLRDFAPPFPRLRQYDGTVEIQPYLHGGSNEVEVRRRPDGEDDTLYFAVVRVESRAERVLAEGEISPGDTREHSVFVEIPAECTRPPLPEVAWITGFLDPLPEAMRTRSGERYAAILVPPRTAEQSEVRTEKFESIQGHLLMKTPPPASAILQDHRSVPLEMNYSCENERLFVYPEDGGDLVTIAEIERHQTGTSSTSVTLRAATLVYHHDRWYLGSP